METSEGRVRGTIEDGLAVFRGVPFAQSPTGPRRFLAPAEPQPRSGTLDAILPASLCPQAPLRLRALGPFDAEQDEDCLTVTIWAPLPLHRPKSMLVWLHGGALSSGGGSHPGMTAPSSRERIVLLLPVPTIAWQRSVSCAEPVSRMAAWGSSTRSGHWNGFKAIRHRLGDMPTPPPLMGQSAGGTSIALMLADSRARGLFRRAIFLSGGFVSFNLKSPEAAARDAEHFCSFLGIDPESPEALRSLQEMPVSQILQAQAAVIRDSVRAVSDALPTFMYTATDRFPIDASQLEAAIREDAAGIDAMMGTTADEFNAFQDLSPALKI